ncbi:hypothetical protein Dret_1533 [Desulfohalobium retbaense DSM 5692]|uniref:Uncharacterized protein n=1 Tax=Desulfohalobium retbaense (strain ATCC 49708 / DSM 5692 / JCM 16813 / HR100) TaxID=485915 RepID=C8X322_DESRD|nr:hypothetical protein Dret_1533 [Desulfohalobium retbaense DSM 5692]
MQSYPKPTTLDLDKDVFIHFYILKPADADEAAL